MTTKLFGTKVPRVEDDRLLRGNGRYVDDLAQDALHAAVLRSPHAHARITGIEVDAVLDVEGVLAVYTYDDLTGAMAEPLPLLIPHPTLTHGRTQYALAKDEVNYAGEAIAFVVAVDRYVAEDALSKIKVTYESLTPVVGLAAARAADHLVHEDVPGNVAARGAVRRGRPRRDRGGTAPAQPRPRRRAQRLHADGGSRHGRPLGSRPGPATGVDVDPDLDRRPGGGGREARARPAHR